MVFENLISARVRGKLSALRLSLRAHLTTRGLACLVVALVAAVFVTLGVDLALKLDRAQRALIDLLVLGGVGCVAWRFLLRPLRVPMGPEDLALVLERHFPVLDDRLISTLQFATRDQTGTGASEALIHRVAEQTDELADRIDPRAVVHAKGTWHRLGLAGGAMSVLLAFSALNPGLMKLWFQRDVLLADVDWPRQTYLTVEGGPLFRVVRGGKLEVTVSADAEHVVPDQVTFHMKFPGLGTVVEGVPAAPGGNTFVKQFDNVSEGFEFYVTGNDDRTPDCRVETVDPPELVNLNFTVIEPDYMRASEGGRSLAASHGVLLVPAGSTIRMDGWTNKDLSAVKLTLDGRDAGELSIKSGEPRAVEGRLALPERPGRTSLTLQFVLTDSENVTNPRGATYLIRIDPDRAPVVAMVREAVRGDVTARAEIPLRLDVNDDRGVAYLGVSATPTTRPSASTRPASTRPAATTQAVKVPRQPQVHAEHRLDLEPMGFTVGELVRVQALAHDTLPESFGGPNVGVSTVQTFKIVSDEEMMDELIRRQKEVSSDFYRVLLLQAEVRDSVRALDERLKASGSDPDAARVLTSAAKDQRRVGTQCAQAAQQLQSVLDEMMANRVSGPNEYQSLQGIIGGKPPDIVGLTDLAKKLMPEIAAAMESASKEADAKEFVARQAEQLVSLYEVMQKVYEMMKKGEDRQELANQLKRLIEGIKAVGAGIQNEANKQGGLLEGTTQPKPR